MHFKSLAILATVGTVASQKATSFCDKYTTALFADNTAENQLKLLTAVVNTAVIGNYSETKTGLAVPGILAPGQVNGKTVNLLPYFNGGLASTNAGGTSGASVNFLDDGGAAPLMKGLAANGKSSRQYLLLTHLYEYFGTLLGCTQQGNSVFPAYAAHASQYQVHKFMNLHPEEVMYFIEQVASAALSFGASAEDLGPVAYSLMSLFGYRCSPPTLVIPTQGAQLQSICSAQDCPLAPNATCAMYNTNVTDPHVAVTNKNGTSPASANKNATSPAGTNNNGTTPGGSGDCGGKPCPSPCKGLYCPGGNNGTGQPSGPGGSGGIGNGTSGGSGGFGGGGQGDSGGSGGSGSGSGTGTGTGAGAGSSGSGSGSAGSGSGSGGSGSGGSGSGGSSSGSESGGQGGSGPEVVSVDGAATLGMSFAAVFGGLFALLM